MTTHEVPESGTQDAADQLAIKRLVYQYALAFDDLDAGLLALCLAPGAEVVGSGVDGRGDLAGELIAAERAERQADHVYSMTFVLNLWHDVRGDAATGRTYAVVSRVSGPAGEWTKSDVHVRFDDELVRIDGRWQFSRRHRRPLFGTEVPVIDYAAFEAESAARA